MDYLGGLSLITGVLPAFSRCSVGIVPHVDVFLMYLCRARSFHVLLLRHLEGLPLGFFFKWVTLSSVSCRDIYFLTILDLWVASASVTVQQYSDL